MATSGSLLEPQVPKENSPKAHISDQTFVLHYSVICQVMVNTRYCCEAPAMGIGRWSHTPEETRRLASCAHTHTHTVHTLATKALCK